MRKRAIIFILCAALALTACAGNGGKPDDSENGDKIEFWSTYATEKVLQDRTDLYDAVKREAVVEVEACKGEYESTQIIMTAKKDVSYYDVEVSSLSNGKGDVFDESNIRVRHEKYIQVTHIFSNNGAPTGWYPDALVPLENIKQRGENKIKGGQNQGIYITFKVPVDQPTGVYTGSMKITYDGNEKVIPVRLTVYDYLVNEETHSKSYFNLGFSLYLGELDSTPQLWRKYVETLAEYRISASMTMEVMGYGEDPVASYVDETYDLVKNYKMSTISIRQNGEPLTTFITAFAEKSIQENEDLVKRIVVKGPDEPSQSNLPSVTGQVSSFHSAINAAVTRIDNLKTKYPDDVELIEQLKASAQKIPYIITLTYGRNSLTDAAGIDTYCPQFSEYDSPENRAKYDDQKERWWYGCISPRPPYPTYHTEDTLISARSVSWMMSEYDIIGNLYWSATVYSRYNGSSYQPIEDYYSGNANRFTSSSGKQVNGDGYLFYPGSHYGIFGPVASIRLEAIRDGNEEYEILRDLRLTYADLGFSTDKIQANISRLIYTGTKVASTSESFYAARKAAIQLTMLAKSAAGVCITDVQDDGKGTITYDIFAKSGYTLKNNGAELTPSSTTAQGNFYTLEIKLENERNFLALSVDVEGTEYRLDYDLGGRAVYYKGDELLDADNKFTDGTATATATIEGEKAKLEVGAVSGKHQSVRYTSAILSAVDSSVKRLVLYVENPTSSDITFRILSKFENEDLNIDFYSGKLKPGINEITITVGNFNLKAYGKLLHADFYFSSASGDHAAKTIFIDGLSIYWA